MQDRVSKEQYRIRQEVFLSASIDELPARIVSRKHRESEVETLTATQARICSCFFYAELSDTQIYPEELTLERGVVDKR
ncbi:hypothetical protein [Paenibacillus ottowii]